MSFKNLIIYPLTLTVALSFISGCGKKSENSETTASGEKEGKTYKIAMIPKGSTHSFWKTVHAGGNKAAQEEGVELFWQGPQREDDRQLQIQVVQNFVSQGVDGIALAPLDDKGLVTPVKAAVNRKIPVVIFDSDLSYSDYTSFVATDNYAGGKLCAKRLSEVLGGKGKVIMLRYAEGSASTLNREQGFLDGIKEFGPGINLISTDQYAGATMEKALQSSQNIINRFGNEVEGIFTSNESATQGMLRALQIAGKAGKIKFVGFDSNETLISALKKGEIQGLTVQNPFKMGYLTIKTMVSHIKGNKVEKRVDTGVAMITPDNLETPEIKELLHPDLKKWLNE